MPGYLEFKLSWAMFRKPPENLDAGEQARVSQVARRQTEIERRILASREAVDVVIPFTTLDARLAEVRGRYGRDEDYRDDLARLGMSEADLSEAVQRDLRVEAVLERISAGTPAATLVDAEIFYRLNPGAFARPEMRRLRHILITFNDAKEKAQARALLEGLCKSLVSAESFAAAALAHSHCPTALQGGEMGVVKPGQLYSELDPAAFALAAGQVTDVLESPTGLHILRCDEILPGQSLAFAEVSQRILDALTEKRRSQAQKSWIKSLPGQS
ncbi:MAG: nitrogen fixation protein NifM [Rhodocyclaceae bacterium]|nr:nitrogen fixation protein NifM [Rhodocyclaceae bacterium]